MVTTTRIHATLESGDRLSRDEFHRRYSEHPEINRAELVEGVVYVTSPVRSKSHSRPHVLVILWLGTYALRDAGLIVDDNATVYLDDQNEVQPDAALWHPEPGVVHETQGDYVEGAPQLVVEVAASSASYDLHDKMEAYRRNGVREYVVWRVLDGALDWFELRAGAYARRDPDAHGIIESAQFPGLRLHVPSLLALDVNGVLAALFPPPAP